MVFLIPIVAERRNQVYMQSGAIPFTPDGDELRLLLITSRKGKRWIFPKGIIEDDLSPRRSAEKEAFEEAGVIGTVSDRVVGEYQFEKWGGICHVKLFALHVQTVLDSWPEDFRERKWVSAKEGIELVERKDLQIIISQLVEFLQT